MIAHDLIPFPVPAAAPPAVASASPGDAYVDCLQSEESRRTMRKALNRLVALATGRDCARDAYRTFPWHLLRYEHTGFLRSLVIDQGRSAATANQLLAALRGVLREAWRLGMIPGDDYAKAVDLKGVKGTTLPRGRCLTAGEVRALFLACAADDGPAGRRDAALLAVQYGLGLRRSEAVSLDLADYSAATGELRVKGKGNKTRCCYVTNGSAAALAGWIDVRGTDPGPLFCAVNKGRNLVPGRLTAQTVYSALVKRAGEANLTNLSPHDLRRSFVSELLDNGADVSLVQRLAGHASVNTTLRYDRRPEEAKRKAAQLLMVPFAAPR
jgi:site-specific recombinase XerD